MNKVIKFSASWCAPCQIMAPIFKQFQEQHQQEPVEILDIDVDVNYEEANLYNVRSVPTTLFFKDNIVIESIRGAVDLKKLNQVYEKSFAKGTKMT